MNLSLRKIFFSELMFWMVICAISLYLILPLRKSIRFGIDLVGGTYLTLEVQTDKAIEADLIEHMQSIDSKLRRAGLVLPLSKYIEKNNIGHGML